MGMNAIAGGSHATQLSPHWRNILDVFQALLATLRQNYVPPFLVSRHCLSACHQRLFRPVRKFIAVTCRWSAH